MQELVGTNQITIVDHNLSHNEAWDKTLINLGDLSKFTTDFFTKINSRIETSHTKLNGIKQRLAIAKNKVHYLPDKNVAFRIRSPLKVHFIEENKFEIDRQFKSLNEDIAKSRFPRMDIKGATLNLHSESQRGPVQKVKYDDYLKETRMMAKSITTKKDPFKNGDAYQNVS